MLQYKIAFLLPLRGREGMLPAWPSAFCTEGSAQEEHAWYRTKALPMVGRGRAQAALRKRSPMGEPARGCWAEGGMWARPSEQCCQPRTGC